MKTIFIDLFGKPEGIVIFQLLAATRFTIYLSLISFIGGAFLAAILAYFSIKKNSSLRKIATVYIWLFQSTPLLMLLFIFGLGFPRMLALEVNIWFAAGGALILYASAYIGEVWRGAIESVSQNQWEAGRAVGLNFFSTFRLIVLPQAFKISIAPTVGFMVQIIKGTSLAYIIGFSDLMYIGKRWANAPVNGTEPYIVFPIMALIYFSLCFPLSKFSNFLEKKLQQ